MHHPRRTRTQAIIIFLPGPAPFKHQLAQDKRADIDKRKVMRRERTLRIAEFQFRVGSAMTSKRKRPIDGTDFIADTFSAAPTAALQSKEERQTTQIIYCSRTHSQLAQFAQEMGKVQRDNEWQVVVLGSRAQMCVNPTVSQLGRNGGGSRVNDACRALRERKGCRYQMHTDHVRDVVLDRVMDVEEIRALGEKVWGCPYYATRSAAEEADFILMPYGSLLHAETRRQLGVNVGDNIVVFDEAHNVFDATADCHSAQLSIIPDTLLLRTDLMAYQAKYDAMLGDASKHAITLMENCILAFVRAAEWLKEGQIITIAAFLVKMNVDAIALPDILQFLDTRFFLQKVRGFTESRVAKQQRPPGGTSAIYQFREMIAQIVSSTPNDRVYMSGAPIRLPPDMTPGTPAPTTSAGARPTAPATSSRTLQAIATSNRIPEGTTALNRTPEETAALNNTTARVGTMVTPPRATVPIAVGSTPKKCRQKEKTSSSNDARPAADDKNSADPSCARVLHFVALDIERHVADVVAEARTTLFLGGTMEPKDEFLAVAPDAITFCAPHIVPEEHTLCRICTHGPTAMQLDFRAEPRNRPEMLQELRLLICNAFETLPRGGCVVFFSSFAFLAKVKEGITIPHQQSTLFAEERGGSPADLLSSFSRAEIGQDLSSQLVLVVGLPYPNPQDPVLLEKMRFLDARGGTGLSAKQFYSAKCMKGVNQSIGRAIRHRNDWAALLLIDHRYANQQVLAGISTWLRHRMVARQFPEIAEDLRQFFKGHMGNVH
eukprot:GEMP01012316.1.p1 GENE.GEMP01012316.1~~GEMP01012316.1.p1  ORF type:complete len:774 (+),score=206.80 GEMP01012316.1:176-2497(+)